MTRHARETVSLALATALAEVALRALVLTDWSQVGGVALLFVFLVGPPLFVALLAWRRRTHPTRTRVLFGLIVVIAVGGLTVLGIDFYRFSTDPQFRQTPNMHALIVPIGQWVVIGVVWLWLVVLETLEKRAADEARSSSGAPK